MTFSVDKSHLIVKQGILIKKERSIALPSIQNVTIVAGPLAQMFGLGIVSIWTASPGQINYEKKKTGHRPDGILYLEPGDARWLRDFLLAHRSLSIIR